MARKDIMLCQKITPKKLALWPAPIIAQPKLNGDRCRAIIFDDGEVDLRTSEGNLILGVPHIRRAVMGLGLRNVELDGELYVHEMRHQDIRSIVSRRQNIHPNHAIMQYHVFDVVNEDTQSLRTGWIEAGLASIIKASGTSLVKVVYSTKLENLAEVTQQLGTYIEDGYEGIIVRHPRGIYERKRSQFIMKLKPRRQRKFTIIGLVEETTCESVDGETPAGIPKNALGAFTCTHDGKTFRVGSGPALTRETRELYWQDQEGTIGRELVVKYQEMSKGDIPIFPVAVEVE